MTPAYESLKLGGGNEGVSVSMKAEQTAWGTYGFRYNEIQGLPLCNLFAVGHECVTDPAYYWDGLTRKDGPLLLLQYTVDGEGIFETNDTSYRMNAGRAFLAEIPGEHRYYLPSDQTHWQFYFMLLRPQLVLPLWNEMKAGLGLTPYLDAGSIPVRMLRDIITEAHAGRITDPYIASSYVYQFITELCRHAAAGQRNREQWPQAVRQAAQFIEFHYNRMIGQEQLAEQLQLSKFHLLRSFTKHVGVTPNDYLNRIRIEKAVELLRTTDWSIEKIGAEVGYSSGSYFIKVFHKLTGQTPGSFRSGNNSLHYHRLYFD